MTVARNLRKRNNATLTERRYKREAPTRLRPAVADYGAANSAAPAINCRSCKWRLRPIAVTSSDLLRRIPQILDAIVSAFDFAELTRNDVLQRRGQAVMHRFLEFAHGRVFAALDLAQNRFVVAASDSGFQIDPGAVHRPGGAARFFGAIRQASRLSLQLICKSATAVANTREERFELRIFTPQRLSGSLSRRL